jgi:hypothetical protein
VVDGSIALKYYPSCQLHKDRQHQKRQRPVEQRSLAGQGLFIDLDVSRKVFEHRLFQLVLVIPLASLAHVGDGVPPTVG